MDSIFYLVNNVYTTLAKNGDTVITPASDCIFSKKQTSRFCSQLRALAIESEVEFTTSLMQRCCSHACLLLNISYIILSTFVASDRSQVERELRVTKTENAKLHEQLREVLKISVCSNFDQ